MRLSAEACFRARTRQASDAVEALVASRKRESAESMLEPLGLVRGTEQVHLPHFSAAAGVER
jgi:hypothetical protein